MFFLAFGAVVSASSKQDTNVELDEEKRGGGRGFSGAGRGYYGGVDASQLGDIWKRGGGRAFGFMKTFDSEKMPFWLKRGLQVSLTD